MEEAVEDMTIPWRDIEQRRYKTSALTHTLFVLVVYQHVIAWGKSSFSLLASLFISLTHYFAPSPLLAYINERKQTECC